MGFHLNLAWLTSDLLLRILWTYKLSNRQYSMRPQARPRTQSSSEERSRYSSSSSDYRETHNSRSRNKDRTQPKKPILKQHSRYLSSSSSRDNKYTTSTNQEKRKRQDKSRTRHERTPPPSTSYHQTRRTSNGSWCMGIKGEMSGTVCVTFTWYMYIYELFIAFVCFVVCSLL